MKFKITLLIAVFAMIPCAFFAAERDAKLGTIAMSAENGDVNGDRSRDITDVVALVNYLFVGGAPPVPTFCEIDSGDGSAPKSVPTMLDNGDIDGSGQVDITDVIRLVNWLYSGGPEPASLGCDWILLD